MKSKSKPIDAVEDMPPALQAATDARERRTIALVKQSVDALVAEGQPVSIAAIESKSKSLDPSGRGVSKTAIHRNQIANQYYKQHRLYKPAGRRRSSSAAPERIGAANPPRIKPDRDAKRARARYTRFTKEELINRLIALENYLSQEREREYENDDRLLEQFLELEARLENGESDARLMSQIEQLKSENRLLKAKFAGKQSLEAENRQLKRQNSHLMHQLQRQTAAERQQDGVSFAQALEASKRAERIEIPEIEF